jgi:hypothetical protein
MTTDTSEKTLSVPEAGRRYFDMGRQAAYGAAKRGDIPTIRIGRLIRVPVRALEKMLDNAGGAAMSANTAPLAKIQDAVFAVNREQALAGPRVPE